MVLVTWDWLAFSAKLFVPLHLLRQISDSASWLGNIVFISIIS